MSIGDLLKDGRYQILAKLGKGSQGVVLLVEELKTNEKKALKRISLKNYNLQDIFNKIVPEINYLFSFKHQNIVKYFEHFASNDFLYLVTEYCEGGDLDEYLANNRLSRKQVLEWFYQIILGVQYLHNNDPPCIHRDLKPLNILIRNNELKIADFGISRVMNSPGSRIKTDIGSPAYMSPEKIRGEDYGLPSDIWSMGVILYEMCMNKLLFRDDDEIQSKPAPKLSTQFEDLNELFEGMVKKEENERPNINRIEKEWKSIIKGLFELKSTLETTSSVRSLIEMNNGNIASGLGNGDIEIWNINEQLCVATLKEHSNGISSLIQLKNGNIVSSSWDKTIKIWDIKTKQSIGTLKGHKECVNYISKLENENIISASDDHTIKIWNVETRECIHTLNGHDSLVNCVIQSNNGNYVSSDWNGLIKIWDTKTNGCISTLNAHSGYCRRVIELKNGFIASTGTADKTIKIWDKSSNKCMATLNGHSDGVWSLIQLRNSRLVSCFFNKTVKIWDFETFECIQTLTEHTGTIYDLLEVKNGKIISGSHDKTIKIWERI